MRIGVDTTSGRFQQGSVGELYLRHVLAQAEAMGLADRFILFTDPSTEDLFSRWPRLCLEKGRRGLPGAIDEAEAGLLFAAFDKTLTRVDVPVVLHALDIAPWEEEEARGPGFRQRMSRKRFVKKLRDVSAFIVPSQYVRQRLFDLFDVALDRTVVTQFGVDEVFGVPRDAMVSGPYVLVVGRTGPCFGISRVLDAIDRLGGESPHNLAVVGPPGTGERDDWGGRVLRVTHCPDDRLASLYQHCAFLLSPSPYDGTGAHLLEAMRAGARIVAARAGAAPEVAGDVPAYFQPDSERSLMDAMRKVLREDNQSRERRIAEGKRRASAFAWKGCARALLNVLARV